MSPMLARVQGTLVIALIAVAAFWAVLFVHQGRPLWALAGGSMLLLGYALALGAEFVLLRLAQGDEPSLRPNFAQLLRAWWGEVTTAPRVFFWNQPFRSQSHPDNLPSNEAGRRPGLVLVHGFVCNRGFWNPWMRELRRLGVPYIAVNLEPVFGSIDQYSPAIESAVAQMEVATSTTVVLVGHSMGGLAIRAWLAQSDADSRVRRIITIGSPHHGTWLARFGHTANGRQMRLDSRWLTQLAAQETPSRRARFTCFFGHCDNIVFPATGGTLPDADNRHMPGTAHVHMAFQAEVFDEVRRWLAPTDVAKSALHDSAALAP
jgi:triacylglycerol lipase